MVRLVKNLPKNRYSPRNYVVADNDTMSKEKMKLIENNSTDVNTIMNKTIFICNINKI